METHKGFANRHKVLHLEDFCPFCCAFLCSICLWHPPERTKARWPGLKRFSSFECSTLRFFYFVHLCRIHVYTQKKITAAPSRQITLSIFTLECVRACWRPIDYWCLPSHSTCVLSVTRVTQSLSTAKRRHGREFSASLSEVIFCVNSFLPLRERVRRRQQRWILTRRWLTTNARCDYSIKREWAGRKKTSG